MRILVGLRLIFIILIALSSMGSLTGCNQQLTNWVGKAKGLPKVPPIPLVPTTPVAIATPGYAISAAGQAVNSVSYKLHFRIGKSEQMEVVTGTNYSLRTGLSSQLKDL